MGRPAFTIRFEVKAAAHLKGLKTFDLRRILAAIESSLAHEPAVESVNRKVLNGVIAGFPFEPPLWELRVGAYRVFYDVDQEARTVTVWTVLKKPPTKTTQEVLDEDD